ncbi:hypothetical protein HYT52_00740 [Candidatus Woesearchaeota archaeon]|nr:hypothetical protein [Candidatus Woesearchaeota archaeon]
MIQTRDLKDRTRYKRYLKDEHREEVLRFLDQADFSQLDIIALTHLGELGKHHILEQLYLTPADKSYINVLFKLNEIGLQRVRSEETGSLEELTINHLRTLFAGHAGVMAWERHIRNGGEISPLNACYAYGKEAGDVSFGVNNNAAFCQYEMAGDAANKLAGSFETKDSSTKVVLWRRKSFTMYHSAAEAATYVESGARLRANVSRKAAIQAAHVTETTNDKVMLRSGEMLIYRFIRYCEMGSSPLNEELKQQVAEAREMYQKLRRRIVHPS